MPKSSSGWNLKAVNTWWQRSITKERARNTNQPKAHKGDRTSTPVNFSDLAPPMRKSEPKVWNNWKAS